MDGAQAVAGSDCDQLVAEVDDDPEPTTDGIRVPSQNLNTGDLAALDLRHTADADPHRRGHVTLSQATALARLRKTLSIQPGQQPSLQLLDLRAIIGVI